jgi:hypothetical protein
MAAKSAVCRAPLRLASGPTLPLTGPFDTVAQWLVTLG